jgi:cell division protein FtsA
MEKYIAAVDLGTKRISVLVGEKTASGKFHVIVHHEAPSRGVTQGKVRNNLLVGDVLKALIDEVKQQEGIDIKEVYAGISGRHIRCIKKTSEVKRSKPTVEISPEEIVHLRQEMYNIHLEDSDSRILDVIPQCYYLDNGDMESDPVGVCSHLLKAEFCLLTAANFPIELIHRSFERAGLEVKGLFLSPLAAAEAVLSDDDKNMGVAVVDIGGGTTSVVVYYEDIIRHVAVIPFGSDVITDDIRKGCAISACRAEQLKVQYGSCYSDLIKGNKTFRISDAGGVEISFRVLAKIIEARVEEIMEFVIGIIQKSGYADQLNAGIVLTGGGAKLGELTEFVRYKTGMKARKGSPLFVTSDSNDEVQHSDYATTVGLLMNGFAYKESAIVKPELEPVIFDPSTIETVAPPPETKKGSRTGKGIGTRIKETITFSGSIFDKLFDNGV